MWFVNRRYRKVQRELADKQAQLAFYREAFSAAKVIDGYHLQKMAELAGEIARLKELQKQIEITCQPPFPNPSILGPWGSRLQGGNP